MSVEIAIESDTECIRNYGPGLVFPTMVCAGIQAGGLDACSGDNGGPLFTGNGITAIQHGIYSWGLSCGLPNYPGKLN